MLSAVIVMERSSVMRVITGEMAVVAAAVATALVSLDALGDLERLPELRLDEDLLGLDLVFSSAIVLLIELE